MTHKWELTCNGGKGCRRTVQGAREPGGGGNEKKELHEMSKEEGGITSTWSSGWRQV